MSNIKIIAVLASRPGKAEALRILLDELYADEDAIAAHRASPHFNNYLSQIENLAERSAFTLDPVAVA